MNEVNFHITREKHLDHLVKVVPLIVLMYAIHSFILFQMRGPLGPDMLLFTGVLLVMMIGAFVLYDVKHQAVLFEDRLEIRFLGLRQVIPFSEIVTVEVFRPEDNFGTVYIQGRYQRSRLFFVDDAVKIKKWIEDHKLSYSQAA